MTKQDVHKVDQITKEFKKEKDDVSITNMMSIIKRGGATIVNWVIDDVSITYSVNHQKKEGLPLQMQVSQTFNHTQVEVLPLLIE